MNDNDALSKIAMIQGIINNVIPVGKDGKPLRLDYQEKLDLIYTRETILEKKIEEAVEMLYQIGVDWQEDLEKSQLDRLSEVIHLLKS